MQNIGLQSLGMRRKQNFEIVCGFTCKSDTAVLTFTFHFLFSPDDITSGRRDMDPHGRLWAAQGRMGFKIIIIIMRQYS